MPEGKPFTKQNAAAMGVRSQQIQRKRRLEEAQRRLEEDDQAEKAVSDIERQQLRILAQLRILDKLFVAEALRRIPDIGRLDKIASVQARLMGCCSEAKPARRPSKAVPMHQIETFVDQAEQQLNSLDTQPLAEQNNTSSLTTQPIIPLTDPPPNNALADDSSNKSILSPNQTVQAPPTGTPQTVGT